MNDEPTFWDLVRLKFFMDWVALGGWLFGFSQARITKEEFDKLQEEK